VPSTCPSAAQASTALALTAPAPIQSNPGGFLACRYNNPNPPTLNISISVGPSEGATPSIFEQVGTAGAKATNSTVSPVPGLGVAAYTWSATIVPGSAPNVYLAVLTNSTDMSLQGGVSLAGLEAMARDLGA
jgi:hypothetical protein